MSYDVRIDSNQLRKLQNELSDALSENMMLKSEVKYLRFKMGYPEWLPGDVSDKFRDKYGAYGRADGDKLDGSKTP